MSQLPPPPPPPPLPPGWAPPLRPPMAPPASVGAGRGRARTLPAWATQSNNHGVMTAHNANAVTKAVADEDMDISDDDRAADSSPLSTEERSCSPAEDVAAPTRLDATAKSALAAAKAKLRQALLAKKRALQTESNRRAAQQLLPPIHALLKGSNDGLVLTLGEQERTRFLESGQEEEGSQVPHKHAFPDLADSDEPLPKKPRLDLKPTREQLLQRRQQVERAKARQHYRLLVAKQQHLQRQQAAQLRRTSQELEQNQIELEQNQQELAQTDATIEDLTARQKVLAKLVDEHVAKLVAARKRLHERKQALQQQEATAEMV